MTLIRASLLASSPVTKLSMAAGATAAIAMRIMMLCMRHRARLSIMKQRKQILWEAQQKISDDLPYISVAHPNNISAFRSDRFTFSPDLAAQPIKWALFNGFSVNS